MVPKEYSCLVFFEEMLKQLIRQAKEKEVPEKWITITEILKDLMIKNEIDKKLKTNN